MSAFEVDDTHIDAMLTGGLYFSRPPRGSTVRWFDSDVQPEDGYQAGEAWGPGAISWATEHRCELTSETADQVGAMLRAENRRSVNHRYAEDELEPIYTYRALPGIPDLVTVLDAIHGYEYQACEHPEWSHSEAHAFCEALRANLLERLLATLRPDGECRGWNISDSKRDIFKSPARV